MCTGSSIATIAGGAALGVLALPALAGSPGFLTDVTTTANIDFVGTNGPSFPEMPLISRPFDIVSDLGLSMPDSAREA